MKQDNILFGLITLVIFLVLIGNVNAWSTNIFNNSLSNENMNMTTNVFQTRYLNVPTNTYLLNGYLNLTGLRGTNQTINYTTSWYLNQGVSNNVWDMVTYGDYIYITYQNVTVLGNVFKYYKDGTYVDSYTLKDGGLGNPYPAGITTNGTYFWIYDYGANLGFKYDMNFNYIDSISFTSSGNDIGMTTNGTYFWIGNGTHFKKWDSAGTFISAFQSPATSHAGPYTGRGIQYYNNYLYISDYDLTKLWEYDTTGSYINNYSLNISNINAGGVTTDGTNIYIISITPGAERVFIYNNFPTTYPSDVKLKIGDGSNYTLPTGTFSTTNKTINLASWINSYTPSCTCIDCHMITGYCQIPFSFISDGSNGVLSYSDMIFDNIGFLENSQTYNSSTYETKYERLSINLTYDSSFYTSISGKLVYNGTSYAGTKSGSGNNIVFYKDLNIPTINYNQNKTFYWNISLTNSSGINYFTSNSNNQTVNQNYFTLCNATYPTKFLNITFKDESDNSNINATIPYSLFTYYLGDGSVNKTYTFINNTGNLEYDFCATPNLTLNVIPTIQYSFTGYPQRVWSPGVQTYSNLTTNQILYLLGTADGQYVTFQVITQSGQVLNGVDVTATKVVGSSTVSSGTTDSAGTVTFWLNPDWEYTLVFSKSGYETQTVTIYPTENSYTVTIGGSTASQITDYTKGINIIIKPDAKADLYNDTTYNFNMTISSDYYSVDSYGFVLKLNNGTVLGSVSSTTLGTISLNLDTGNYKRIIMYYNWTVNGTISTRTTYWNIQNSGYSSWSIKNFFTDLNNYLNTDMFGIDDFGRNLIIYLILFISIGVMNFKYGITSPIAICTMIFAIVYFFDVSVGLLTSPIEAIPNFFTWLAGVILAVFVVKEVMI